MMRIIRIHCHDDASGKPPVPCHDRLRALVQLAARTGLLVGVDAVLVRNHQAAALKRRYTPQAALQALLLQGSGLDAAQ